MQEEIEIQVILKNPKKVEKKLREIAKFIKAKDQKDEYFSPRHEDFFEPNVPIKYLRVRHEEGKNEVAYHYLHFDGNQEKSKTDEYETAVEDPNMMSTILKKLDMSLIITVTKHRKTFDYKDFEIVLDYIEELGHFMEVEAKKLFGDYEETKRKCYEILKEIGAEYEEATIKGYPNMILAKNELG